VRPRCKAVGSALSIGALLVLCLGTAFALPAAAGGQVALSSAVSTASATADIHVNFQPAAAPVPAGYTVDSGGPYSATTGFGWVTQASLSTGTHVPLDLTPNTRDRNVESDQRLDTFIHMQYPSNGSTSAVMTPGAWEYALANGTYTVTVALGDPVANFDPENYVIHAEGVTMVNNFVPSGANGSTTRHAIASATITVADGRLTIDAIGGTNTKLDYVDIVPSSGPDTTPPAAPANVSATPGDARVQLAWTPNTENDLAGYNVYRGTSTPVATTTPINGSSLLTSASFLDTGVTNGTTYFYVVSAVDTSGNSAASATVSAMPTASTPPFSVNVNFQDDQTTPPSGYVRDFGQPYGARTDANQGSGLTYGWVTPGTTTPLSLVGNGRNRNSPPYSVGDADVRRATFVHMQYTGTSGVASPGAWEIAVPNGSYIVAVGVGDDSFVDSVHQINIEGQTAIAGFQPSTSNLFASATRTVTVSDGRLTIDAVGGTNTKLDYALIQSSTTAANPAVTSVSPSSGATGVFRDAPVTAEVTLPNLGAGIDEATLNSTTVRLTRTSDNTQVAAHVNTSGGGDVIVLQPSVVLEANTQYRFDVTSGLKDVTGAAFAPFTSTFTTGSTVSGGGVSTGAAFSQTALPTATGKSFTSVVVGPDHKLYAATLNGEIDRFTINADGTLGAAQVINSIITANGGARTIIGLAFDPAATASNLVLWVSHSFFWDGTTTGPDWAGKITRLSGADLATVQDYVVNLPRSIRDHETNSIAFGPDGALYISQGSNSTMGAPDSAWGNRPEHLLSAAILRLDPSLVTTRPLDVKTEAGGTYNPFAAGAPLTIYASGVRNAYDLVWHRNGQLYAPTNGSAAGGNTPATPSPLPAACQSRVDSATNGAYTGPQVPALTNVATAQDDYLFRIVKSGYYGHPDPARCEWVLNGGNPTSGTDPSQVSQYPVGTQPDRNWRGAAYDFGLHFSPDGAVEYKGNAFGGALDGKLLVTRYSAGDDIIALTPGGANLDIVSVDTGIAGFSGFVDPLDLTEDLGSGNLYVTELGAQRITLLKPVTGPRASLDKPRLLYNTVQNAGPSPVQNVTITNSGGAALTISAATISGTNASQFQLSPQPALPATLQPGGSMTIGAVFTPTSTGPKAATLQLTTNDPATPQPSVTLRGLGTLGLGGTNEPSLQWILDTYQIPVNVGDPDPTDSLLPATALLGDEIPAQSLMKKAGSSSVTIQPLAVFGPQSSSGTVANLGWYPSATPSTKQQLFTVGNSSYQTVNPVTSGSLSFDPGSTAFGLYTVWPAFSNREVDSDDALNTWEPTVANQHKVRIYPLKTSAGAVVASSYVVVFEESTSAYDYQDIVAIISNVDPVSSSTGTTAQINFQPATAPIPSGYTVDSGGAYSDARGFGWVTQASLSGATHAPLDLTPNTRDRNIESDQRTDTLIHMQYPSNGSAGNVTTPGAWEYALPNGTYTVTATLGDPLSGGDAENYTLHVEGVTAVSNFVPSGANGSASRHTTATVTVPVTDGRLTIDAIGGVNTKLDYVLISPSSGTSNGHVTLQNLDGVPSNSRLVFSRIGTLASPPATYEHDRSTLRIKNTGTGPLQLTGLPITGPWRLAAPVALPMTIPAGGQLDVTLIFIAESGSVWSGTLTVQSDDPTAGGIPVQLAGWWQTVPEGGVEPSVAQLINGVFGYRTTITGAGQQLNQAGLVAAVGDEVLSPYWRRADATKPASVTQLDAFHSQGASATIYWYAKNTTARTSILTVAGTDAQTVLPRLWNSSTGVATATFTPNSTSFGFNVDGTEWSDPTLNNQSADQSNGCPGPCGHHVRFWPVKDASGAVVPNTWLMAMDYAGINYDYNDNLYLISNVTPDPDGQTYYRLDAAGSSTYTDSLGRTWAPDTGLFQPSTAIAETGDIAGAVTNTNDPTIYRTYRGNVGNVTLDQRVLTYTLPISGTSRVNVRLHFAERFSVDATAGKRVFQIAVNGTTISPSFDIVKYAGAANRALVIPLYHVGVVNGAVTIKFSAVVDYPSIAGIEVVNDP
jgi:hypothetical protein